MTTESLTKGNDLHEEILRRKKDLGRIEVTQVLTVHGCTGQPTEAEKVLTLKIKAYMHKVVSEDLRRLEKEFAKL